MHLKKFAILVSLDSLWLSDAIRYHRSGSTLAQIMTFVSLQWRHNGRDSVSNHQPCECLPSRLIRRRSKKTKLIVTGLCAGNSPETGEFPAQRASNAENVSIWWCHHVIAWCQTPEMGSQAVLWRASCLTEPNHYQTECWLIISQVLWQSSEDSFTRDTQTINHWN